MIRSNAQTSSQTMFGALSPFCRHKPSEETAVDRSMLGIAVSIIPAGIGGFLSAHRGMPNIVEISNVSNIRASSSMSNNVKNLEKPRLQSIYFAPSGKGTQHSPNFVRIPTQSRIYCSGQFQVLQSLLLLPSYKNVFGSAVFKLYRSNKNI